MKPLFKDEPREWRRFMLQFCVLGLLLSIILTWRGVLAVANVPAIAATLLVLALAALAKPHWFRGFYRLAMIVSAWLGERVGKVVLSLLFLIVLTPLGSILRLFRHDPLALRRPADSGTFWQPVRRQSRLDRMH
jgi:hypothetical protein